MQMFAIRPFSKFLVCGALAWLTACSSGADTLRASPTGQSSEFGEEDKRAAQALSVGNTQAMAEADGPYGKTLLCRNGMEALAGRFQEARGLSESQRQGIEQARAYFDSQLRVLGRRQGKSVSDIRADLGQVAQDNPDATANVRIAIGCLQRLLRTD